MTDYEFEQWFKAEWAKVTEELKEYNLSGINIVADESKMYP